jgi:LemA protein
VTPAIGSFELPSPLDVSRRFVLNRRWRRVASRVWTAVVIAAVGLGVWVVVLFNGLVRLRNTSNNAWSDVDVHLKKRHDLVPNLVETVKGYAKHEKDTLERVVLARNQAASAASTEARGAAEDALTQSLRGLVALAEAYPDLKANEGFLSLQRDLSRIEDDIANARRYYNAVVRDFNTKQEVFPANLLAGLLGFETRSFFQAEAGERQIASVRL